MQIAPAPGFRDSGYYNGYGTLYDVGFSGYSCSATVAGTDTRYLYFSFNGITTQGNRNRAFGLQLRCLQE